MKGTFCIIEVRPQWYNLLVRDTYYCLSSGSNLNTLEDTLYHLVRKYKTKDRLLKALSHLSDGGVVSPATFNQRQKRDNKSGVGPFNDLIQTTLIRAINDNRKDTPYHRIKNKVKVNILEGSPLTTKGDIEILVRKLTPLKINRSI